MKKIFYTILSLGLSLGALQSRAQYTITSHSVNHYIDTVCSQDYFLLNSSGYTSGLSVHTWYGDGTDDVTPLMSAFIGGTATFGHEYTSAGTYTVKEVLTLGGVNMDSVEFFYSTNYCQTLVLNLYGDVNGNCSYDSGIDTRILEPVALAVDSNGVRVDTFVVGSAVAYATYGNTGDIYRFSVISAPAGLVLTCPSSGFLEDTVSFIVNDYHTKYLGFVCSGAPGYDAGLLVSSGAGRHRFTAQMVVTNQFCNASPVTVTMNMNPKYQYWDAYPAPTTISGNTLTWSFPAASALSTPYIYVHGEVPGAWLTAGDTVMMHYRVTPIAGDADTTDNDVVIIDTVTSSFDPNNKKVDHWYWIPTGAGSKLTYTVNFENTGNDTAFNIHIMDTLDANLDVRTLELVGATAPVQLGVQNIGGLNIVKFDFANINLLDSSHHGQCDGFVMYSIKTRDFAPTGTYFRNKASIYFDYNAPILTNTTENRVGIPIYGVNTVNGMEDGITIYPNPAENELYISWEKGDYTSVIVTNTVGQQVIRQNLAGNAGKLNLNTLPNGNYFLTLKGKDGVKVKQFVKM
jgi:hypothetical protein